MITVYYKNDLDQGCVIRPTPLISISHTPIKNKIGTMGSTYNITLNGTIIADEGSPIYTSNSSSVFGPNGKFNQIGPNYDGNIPGNYTRPPHESVNYGDKLSAIFTKQQAIRELFALDGQKMEILPITGDEPILVLYPKVESINFEEGIYIDICKYTINLVADRILDNDKKTFIEGSIFSTSPSGSNT